MMNANRQPIAPFSMKLLFIAVACTVGSSTVRCDAQTKPDLKDKVVLANADRYPVTFRAGTFKKEIAAQKATVLSPKKLPISFEVWSGNKTVQWERQTIKEPGLYLFRFTGGKWTLTKRDNKPKTVASTANRSALTARQGVGSRSRVVQRGGGSRVRVYNPNARRPWRGRYWSGPTRALWAAGNIYRFIRDEADRELFWRYILDGEIDDAIREEIEDRIWDAIDDDAVNLPLEDRELLDHLRDELDGITDQDWDDAVNLPADEWDQLRDQLSDELGEEDWGRFEDDLASADTMDLSESDLASLDDAGMGGLEADMDLSDLDGATLDDLGTLDIGDISSDFGMDDFTMDAGDLDLGSLADLGGSEWDLSGDLGGFGNDLGAGNLDAGGLDAGFGGMDPGYIDGGGWDSYDYGGYDWGGGNDWGGADYGGYGGGDWGGGFGGYGGGGYGGGGYGGGDFGGGFDFGGFDF